MKIKLLVIILLSTMAATAGGVVKMDLKKCISMALENDQRIKIAVMELQKAKYQRNELAGNGLPQVKATGDFQDYLKLPTQLIPGEIFGMPGQLIPVQFGTNYNMTGSIQVSQLVYSHTYITSIQLAKKLLEIGNLNIEKNKQEVISDVSQMFYMALLMQLQLKFLEETYGKIDTMTIVINIQRDNGFLKKVDADRMNVTRTNMQTDISNLKLMFEQQLNLIKYFTGLESNDSIVLSEPDKYDAGITSISHNADNHIDLLMLDRQKQAAKLQMQMAVSEGLPNLAFFGSFSKNNQQNDFSRLFNDKKSWLGTSIIGLSLNVPIFSGLQKYYKMKQYKIQYDELTLARNFTKKYIETGIENSMKKVIQTRASVQNQQNNVKLATDVFDVVTDQYNKGVAPLTDLLNAETSLISSQSSYVQSLIQMKLAEIEYLKSTGNLSNL